MRGDDYLARILSSRVYEVARVTPLEEMKMLSDRLGFRLLLKREDLQSVHSFKIRGAYNKMSRLTAAELRRGVLAASAGNHAQGVALSAQKLGARATIVMPKTTPDIKIEAVRSYGARVVLSGESYSDAAAAARKLGAERGLTFIHPYDDPDVIAGQGTVAKEILEQCPTVNAIFIPIGGGGFAAGVAAYVKSVNPSVKVYGVEPEDSDCMYRSIRARRRVTVEQPGLFADGVCVKTPGVESFRLCRMHLDGIVRVLTSETCEAIEDIFAATRVVCEPAGALALAAAKKTLKRGMVGAAIVSGANVNFSSLMFISAVATFSRFWRAIMRDGRVCLAEAREMLRRLENDTTLPPDLVELMDILRAVLKRGKVGRADTIAIGEHIHRLIDRSIRTANDRAIIMG